MGLGAMYDAFSRNQPTPSTEDSLLLLAMMVRHLFVGNPRACQLSAAELMIADIQAHDLPVSQTLRKYAQRILDYTHDSPEVHMWVVVFENGPA
jgi:hypothetical protein